MARKIETREFEGLRVTAQQHPALECLSLVPRLGTHLSGLLAAMGEDVSMTSDVSALLPFLPELFKTLTATEIRLIAIDLFKYSFAEVGGKRVDLNSENAVNLAFEDVSLMGMLGALVWVAGLNLGFTSGLPQDSGTGS